MKHTLDDGCVMTTLGGNASDIEVTKEEIPDQLRCPVCVLNLIEDSKLEVAILAKYPTLKAYLDETAPKKAIYSRRERVRKLNEAMKLAGVKP